MSIMLITYEYENTKIFNSIGYSKRNERLNTEDVLFATEYQQR